MSRATLAGCGSIVLWSFLALLSRGASSLPPLELTAGAFAVSGVLGLGVIAARGELGALRQPPLAWAHGVGGLFGFHALYFASLAWAPPAEANLINYLWPLLIVLFAGALLGMKLRPRHLAGAAIGAAGCVLLLAGNATPTAAAVPGYVLALASAITWALYSVLSRRISTVPTEAVAGFCAVSAILAALAHVAFEQTIAPDWPTLLAVVATGAGPVGAAFFLWDVGMKRGDPRLLGALAYATPVASTLLLCAGGYAVPTFATLTAALMVAVGGLIAARA